MRILGLTGGIAMGKSFAAASFRRAHVPVFDADAVVHRLQSPGGAAIPDITTAFPGTVRAGVLDRPALRARVLSDPAALRRLEAILHPLVRAERDRFLSRHRRAGAPLAVLDIPLLFETGAERVADHVAVVSAPAAVQRARLVRRGILTAPQIDAVLARQMPDRDRRRRADTLIRTGLSRAHATRALRRLMQRLA